jgi:putative MFS transporter
MSSVAAWALLLLPSAALADPSGMPRRALLKQAALQRQPAMMVKRQLSDTAAIALTSPSDALASANHYDAKRAARAALLSDVLCGLGLFGGAAFVWQLPVMLDTAIGVSLQFSAPQTIQATTAIFVAWSVGSTVLGSAADRIGRKVVAVGSGVVAVVHLLLLSVASSLGHVIGARLLGGFALGGMMQAGFSLATENVHGPERKSATAANLHYASTAVVLVIVALHKLCGWQAIGWRMELRLCAALLAPMILLCGLFVPESPAFLSSRNLRARSKAERPGGDGSRALQKPTTLASDRLLAYWQPLARCCFAFVAGGVTFYGLSYQAGSISDSLLFNVAALSLLELPGYKLADLLGQAGLGIRRSASLLFGLCGLLLLAVGVGTGVLGVNLAIAAFLGKMCAAGAFQLVTLIPAQDFPDHLRSTGLGISSTVARLAIILVPSLARAVPISISCICFAVLAISASGVLLMECSPIDGSCQVQFE